MNQYACNQFNFVQCIEEPTHFTGNSSSIIDLLFVANKDSILTSGVGEPCLDLKVYFGAKFLLQNRIKLCQRMLTKNLSFLPCIYPEKSRIKHQIFTCPKVDNHMTRKKPISVRDVTNVYGHHTHRNKRRTCRNLSRYKPLYHITITLCTAEFETIYPLHHTTKTEKEIIEIAKHIKYFHTEKEFFSRETKQFISRSYCTTDLSDYIHVYWIIGMA